MLTQTSSTLTCLHEAQITRYPSKYFILLINFQVKLIMKQPNNRMKTVSMITC